MLSLLAAAASGHAPIYWQDLGLRPGIELGFFTLRFYSLAYIAGIALAYWHLTRMLKAPGAPMGQRHAEDLFFYCTLGIILGGRLGYALFYTGGETGIPSMFTHFTPTEKISWDLLRLWDGGMSFHGGVLGVLAAILWVSWRGKLPFLRVCDYIAVNVPFGMMFGRLANFVNGELWGRQTDVPWAMVFPSDPLGVPRHPSQLYEAGLEGALLIVIMLTVFWKTGARFRPGLLVGLFTAGIAAARFTVEFFRQPDAQLTEFAQSTGLSMGQWLTIPLMIVGLALVARALMKPPLASGK
ncbi:MAG: prolipoprotein diacylglyceryl transferase [Candidatus Andeanibacterium colombiense]|uniref:Phosphatidylglycerol--prolipoprotein diacylglyceryl transferase n=1 Tax=Candidatus Andeanibacterium colombiense TaxID=3121345 RepID=A0AAJ5X338_9SPHN|nr:MAG: prolipoprotein diacylglyceryl transferase [Sphingomonadaceae bacterium]